MKRTCPQIKQIGVYFHLVYFKKQSVGPGLPSPLHTLRNDPKEQEWSARKGEVERRKPASVLNGQGFPLGHPEQWVSEWLSRCLRLTQGRQERCTVPLIEVRCLSLFPPPLAITDQWVGHGHCICAKGERQFRIWNSNSQVLMLAMKYCLSNKTARIPDY